MWAQTLGATKGHRTRFCSNLSQDKHKYVRSSKILKINQVSKSTFVCWFCRKKKERKKKEVTKKSVVPIGMFRVVGGPFSKFSAEETPKTSTKLWLT